MIFLWLGYVSTYIYKHGFDVNYSCWSIMTQILFSLIVVLPLGSLWFSSHVVWFILLVYFWSVLLRTIERLRVHLWFEAVVNDHSYMCIIWFQILDIYPCCSAREQMVSALGCSSDYMWIQQWLYFSLGGHTAYLQCHLSIYMCSDSYSSMLSASVMTSV